MEKIELGVMVMKDGKAWGVAYEDGHCTEHGWVDPCEEPIHNPKFCRQPTDVTYTGSPDTAEIKKGKIFNVKRVTTVTFTCWPAGEAECLKK